MTPLTSHPNPDLAVTADNKQGWNQPAARRKGFHSAHLLFRRSLLLRSRRVLELRDTPSQTIAAKVKDSGLTELPALSALVVAEADQLLFGHAAADFAIDAPHSIQSITKMHMHLIAGELIGAGRLDPDATAGSYLPWLGSGYHGARVADLLDMNVTNDFSEDYSDPDADCYTEEEALGWRLPPEDRAEPTLQAFAAGLTGGDLVNKSGYAAYKSANTDVLTLIAARLTDLPARLTAITDAAGYAGGLHISLSPEGLPAFSGGGCLSATDLARFGLLFARRGQAIYGSTVGNPGLLAESLIRPAPILSRSRHWQRYSNHLMVDGRFLGHAGYGGQYLMVDMESGRVAAFLSVLENDSGYDEGYMRDVVRALQAVLAG